MRSNKNNKKIDPSKYLSKSYVAQKKAEAKEGLNKVIVEDEKKENVFTKLNEARKKLREEKMKKSTTSIKIIYTRMGNGKRR